LNENRNRLFDADYQTHLANIADGAEEIKTFLASFVEFDEA
jgi:hypothetical protein